MGVSRRGLLTGFRTSIAGLVLGSGCAAPSVNRRRTTETLTEQGKCIGDVEKAIAPSENDVRMTFDIIIEDGKREDEAVVLWNEVGQHPLDLRGHTLRYGNERSLFIADEIVPIAGGATAFWSTRPRAHKGALQSCPPILIRGAGFDEHVLEYGMVVSLVAPDGSVVIEEPFRGETGPG